MQNTPCVQYISLNCFKKCQRVKKSKLHPFYAEITKNLTAADHMARLEQELAKQTREEMRPCVQKDEDGQKQPYVWLRTEQRGSGLGERIWVVVDKEGFFHCV